MTSSPTALKQWEEYGDNVHRMKVDGGYLYNSVKGLVFVPDVPTPPLVVTYAGGSLKDMISDE
jgi:hypothetical protein